MKASFSTRNVSFGLIGGPLAYLAGHKIGGIQFIDQTMALTVLAVGWTIIMPALVRLSVMLDGISDSGEVIGQRVS